MLTFIKKKLGIASETEEQGSCCEGSNTGEAQVPTCGCGGSAQKPETPRNTRTGCCS